MSREKSLTNGQIIFLRELPSVTQLSDYKKDERAGALSAKLGHGMREARDETETD